MNTIEFKVSCHVKYLQLVVASRIFLRVNKISSISNTIQHERDIFRCIVVEDINSVCDFHNSEINILDAQTINFVKTIKHSQKEEITKH
jgi:hypothetical protein